MEVKASQKLICKLRIDNRLLEEYEEVIIDKDDFIRKLEMGKIVTDKVIKSLKDELNLQGKEMHNLENISTERERLVLENQSLEKDILDLQRVNNSKEDDLKAIKIEMEILEDKIVKLKENEVTVDEKSNQTDPILTQTHFQCEHCGKEFNRISDLEIHKKTKHESSKKHLWEIKMNEMEKEVISVKLELSYKLGLLKEKESEEKNSCHCRNFCRIFHPKHNYKKSMSDQILGKMQKIV